MSTGMMAIGFASIMILIGITLRSTIKVLQKILLPAAVIAGVIGMIFMNTIGVWVPLGGVESSTFSDIVSLLFTISFITIGLTEPKKSKKSAKVEVTDKKTKKKGSGIVHGGFGLGILWSMLYVLTPMVGILVLRIVGNAFDMAPEYALLIPLGFCQGPGQAVTFGLMFENVYGYANATMVGATFSVLGFIFAFAIGVPLAKFGLKKGLSKYKGSINEMVERGYYKPEEQRESMGKVTMHSGNIETLAVHVAVISVCYVLGVGIMKLASLIPGAGPTMSGMLFIWGMTAAYIVKAIMKKLGIYSIINNAMMTRITGFTSDFLVVAAFMAVQLSVISAWLIPILIAGTVTALLTLGVTFYFGARLGSDHDFERILGLYGTGTGTTPSGIALIRMVDPKFQTPSTNELGMMNVFMILTTPYMIIMPMVATKTVSVIVGLGMMLILVAIYLVVLKLSKLWNKPTISFTKGRLTEETTEESSGFLHGEVVYNDIIM